MCSDVYPTAMCRRADLYSWSDELDEKMVLMLLVGNGPPPLSLMVWMLFVGNGPPPLLLRVWMLLVGNGPPPLSLMAWMF